MSRRLVAVAGDVFAGFFAEGVAQAGFDVPLHLAHTNYGLKTFRLNFPNTEVREGAGNWARNGYPDPVHLMFTNPPCASWSSAGMSRCGRCNSLDDKWKEDPRSLWSVDLADAGIQMKTSAWIWESVTNAWTRGRAFVDKQAERWLKEGYSVTVLLQNNLYLGAPQNRKRMFFIAHKKPLVWPELTSVGPTAGEILKQVREEHDHLQDGPALSKSRDGYERLWLISRKKNYANFHAIYHKMTPEERVGIRPIPGFACKMLHPDRHAPVLNELVVHPEEPRMLSIHEIKALSGISDSWKFSGGYNASALEMARTVLPPVGRWVAEAVKNGITKALPKSSPKYRVVDVQSGVMTEEVIS